MTNTPNIDAQIARLEERLAELRKSREDDRRKLLDSVAPEYQFTIERVQSNHQGRHALMDPSVVLYSLVGKIVNKDALKAAGHSVDSRMMSEGYMLYLFNTLSGRFVCAQGGGHIWLRTADWGSEADPEWSQVEAFVRVYPEGGDITHIVDQARARRMARS